MAAFGPNNVHVQTVAETERYVATIKSLEKEGAWCNNSSEG